PLLALPPRRRQGPLLALAGRPGRALARPTRAVLSARPDDPDGVRRRHRRARVVGGFDLERRAVPLAPSGSGPRARRGRPGQRLLPEPLRRPRHADRPGPPPVRQPGPPGPSPRSPP